MQRNRRLGHRAAVLAAITLISMGLSGCIAALGVAEIGANALAAGAIEGASGVGDVKVEYQGTMPVPLPPAKRVAVWPGDEGDAMFAEKISHTSLYEVTPPAQVSPVIAAAKIDKNLKDRTPAQRDSGFETVCKSTGVDLIFAMVPAGSPFRSGATTTVRVDILAFGCQKDAVVWRDQMTATITGNPKSKAINDVASTSLAGRIADAKPRDTGSDAAVKKQAPEEPKKKGKKS